MIYMDNAATTRVKDEVIEAMLPYLGSVYGNPSSVHAAGRAARKACADARRKISAYLGCEARELYVTSGGSEADSGALLSCAENAGSRRTLIVSAIAAAASKALPPAFSTSLPTRVACESSATTIPANLPPALIIPE